MYEVRKIYMSCYQLSVHCGWREHRQAGGVVGGGQGAAVFVRLQVSMCHLCLVCHQVSVAHVYHSVSEL